MGGLNRPILVADAEVITGRLDSVMIAKALIAFCRIIMGLAVAPCRKKGDQYGWSRALRRAGRALPACLGLAP